MTPLEDPGYALTGRLVTILRGWAPLTTLLFAPQAAVSPDDTRIYMEDANLLSELREILPRVLVGVVQGPFDVEQDDSATPQGEATVSISVFVESDQRDFGERIMAQIRVALGSTVLSDSTIIAAGLVPLGIRPPVREIAFRDAWRLTRLYRAPHIGVLP